MVKSILLSFTSSRLDSSKTTLAPFASKTVSSSPSFASFSLLGCLSVVLPGAGADGIAFGSLEDVFNAGGCSSSTTPLVELPDGMAFGSLEDVFKAGGASSCVDLLVLSGEGSVVRDIMYWKPWQPPLSTVILRARFGFESFFMISESLLAALEVISMFMSLPSSSFRGLKIAAVA